MLTLPMPMPADDDYGMPFTLALLRVAFEERSQEVPGWQADRVRLRLVRAPLRLVGAPPRSLDPA